MDDLTSVINYAATAMKHQTENSIRYEESPHSRLADVESPEIAKWNNFMLQ